MQKIEIVVEQTTTGYCAYARKYAAYTTGNCLPELRANMQEALNLYFEDEGKIVTENDIKVL